MEHIPSKLGCLIRGLQLAGLFGEVQEAKATGVDFESLRPHSTSVCPLLRVCEQRCDLSSSSSCRCDCCLLPPDPSIKDSHPSGALTKKKFFHKVLWSRCSIPATARSLRKWLWRRDQLRRRIMKYCHSSFCLSLVSIQ